jgi:hypothetical protein
MLARRPATGDWQALRRDVGLVPAVTDGDGDDRAVQAAPKPSINTNGQALGQLLNGVA